MTREEYNKLIHQTIWGGHFNPNLTVNIDAALRLAEYCLLTNAKTHEPFDWKSRGVYGNINAALNHLAHWIRQSGQIPDLNYIIDEDITLVGDPNEDHLLHAFCRIGFALQLREEEKNK